jgi:hypothetical protein
LIYLAYLFVNGERIYLRHFSREGRAYFDLLNELTPYFKGFEIPEYYSHTDDHLSRLKDAFEAFQKYAKSHPLKFAFGVERLTLS